MNKIDKKTLAEMLKKTDVSVYSHIIICLNQETGICFLKFVLPTENIESVKNNLQNKGIYGMLSIDKSYDCVLSEQKETQSENTKLNNNQRIKSALEYAIRMHQNQYRHDGSEYINHPIRVANYVRKFKDSNNIEDLYISALLHDVIEDTEATYYDIVRLFGPQIASIVLELTNDDDLKKEIGKTKYLEIKMKNMSSWALVIKLCDRLDNVSDLMASNEPFRNKYLSETMEIINFVLEKRELSKTHIKIIKCIIERVNFVAKTCGYKEFNDEIEKTTAKIRKLIPKNITLNHKK